MAEGSGAAPRVSTPSLRSCKEAGRRELIAASVVQVGPSLTLANGAIDPDKLAVRTLLNGQIMQDSNTADMIYNVSQIISFLSQGTTLQAGTLILTGTPEVPALLFGVSTGQLLVYCRGLDLLGSLQYG